MTRLVVTAEADADIGQILTYLGREAGAQVAATFGDRFLRKIETLAEIPEAGAPRPALGPNIRVAIVFPYVLIYEYVGQDDTVTLLRILHGRRNVARVLLGR